jgi:hypothetical protein
MLDRLGKKLEIDTNFPTIMDLAFSYILYPKNIKQKIQAIVSSR